MSAVKLKKIKTEWRGVEYDDSQGSESYDDLNELMSWGKTYGYENFLHTRLPRIEVPEKKPTYPGEKRSIYLHHGDWIVVSSRGKVKVLSHDEFYEKFQWKI